MTREVIQYEFPYVRISLDAVPPFIAPPLGAKGVGQPRSIKQLPVATFEAVARCPRVKLWKNPVSSVIFRYGTGMKTGPRNWIGFPARQQNPGLALLSEQNPAPPFVRGGMRRC